MSPPPFFRFPAMVRDGSARVADGWGRAEVRGGGPNRRLDLTEPGGADPEPPGEDSARVANSSHGPTGGGGRWKERWLSSKGSHQHMRSSACHINVPNSTEPSQRVTHTVCRPLRAAASSAAVALARCLQRPRRLISRAPDLPLLALGRGTMAPCLCPETLCGGSSALSPVKPRCRSSFVRRPHGKLSACDSVSAPLSAPGRATDNSENRRSPTGAGCALNCVSFTLCSLERG